MLCPVNQWYIINLFTVDNESCISTNNSSRVDQRAGQLSDKFYYCASDM